MAEHSSAGAHGNDMEAHRATYEGFIKGSIALTLICLFVLVALANFRFTPSFNVFWGFAGLIVGIIAVAVDARSGSRWLLSLAVLILYGLLTAFLIS